MKKNLIEIFSLFKKISAELTIFSTLLLEEGWFFDYPIPINHRFREIAKYEKEIFNLYMEVHFEENVDKIEELTIQRFPNRKIIIHKAIKSHKIGDYELSIPIIISQADGIFREITSKEFYSKRGNTKAENIIEELKNDKFKEFSLWIFEPLKYTKLISANFKESIESPDLLHRNPILHGEDIDYATKRNAAKSLSLLNYIVKIVYDLYLSTNIAELEDLVIKNSK